MHNAFSRQNVTVTISQGIIKTTGNERFAYDTYRRFLNMYSDVVMDLDKEPFEEVKFYSAAVLKRNTPSMSSSGIEGRLCV